MVGDCYILFGDGESWYGIWCLSVREASSAVGICYAHSYQAHSPKLTESARWSFLLFQDGVSTACSSPPSVTLVEKDPTCWGKTKLVCHNY